ncbi:MAG: hypothetical protein ACOYL6_16880 [Bacteriovoracaceae bacterium]
MKILLLSAMLLGTVTSFADVVISPGNSITLNGENTTVRCEGLKQESQYCYCNVPADQSRKYTVLYLVSEGKEKSLGTFDYANGCQKFLLATPACHK